MCPRPPEARGRTPAVKMFLRERGLTLGSNEYLRLFHRSRLLLLVFAAMGVLLGGAAAWATPAIYTSQTQLFVAVQNSGSLQELQQSNTFLRQRVQSYVTTASSPYVLQGVIDALGLDMSPRELRKKVEVQSEPNTVVISIVASDPSPERATGIAQTTAQRLITAVSELEASAESGESQLLLTVITPGEVPTEPSVPDTGLYLLLGLAGGLAAGSGIALFRAKYDTKVRGEADVRTVTDLPLLGAVTSDTTASKKHVLSRMPSRSPMAEAFRQIRTNLQFTYVSHASRTILITSAIPGEGKTSTAINLAITMAQAGQSVVIVDADLRQPKVGEYLGLEQGSGLTTALIGKARLDDLLQPYGQNELSILTCGQLPPNPSELLGSAAMAVLIGQLEERFDAVIIDAPPILPVTDAAVLSRQVGGVVVIAAAGIVRTTELAMALNSLKLVDAGILGIVLNRVATNGPDSHAHRFGSYTSLPRRDRKPTWLSRNVHPRFGANGKNSEQQPEAAMRPELQITDKRS